jgi:hypothetical protein
VITILFGGFGISFLSLSKKGMLRRNMYTTGPHVKPGFCVTSCLGE